MLSHRNLRRRRRERQSVPPRTRAEDVILAALPLSFDAGLSQLTTAFTRRRARRAASTTCCRATCVTACARARVTGLSGVPPLWIQLAVGRGRRRPTASLRYFANTGGRMPRPILDRLREHFPAAQPYLMYGLTEAFRSTYLDPAEVDRRPDSIGKAIPNAEILVVRPDGAAAGRARSASSCTAGHWSPSATGTTRSGRPGGSVRLPGARRWRPANWRCGPATPSRRREGFLYFVGRSDEMIKTSGYRVSPTEIEEVAYATGLVRDAVALGVEDPALGQRIVLIVTPTRRASWVGDACSATSAATRRTTWSQRRSTSGPPSRAAQRQVRPRLLRQERAS